MKFYYQLIFLGSEVEERNKIKTNIINKVRELKLPDSIINFIDSSNFNSAYKGNQPVFAVYFGSQENTDRDLDIVDTLMKDSNMILPLFYGCQEDNSFEKEIPEVLRNQNGMQYLDKKLGTITNIILESFDLLRSARRIFISYKRSESTSVAIQLFEKLESSNYNVFLDTHSIGKSKPFQEELWHTMSDCDVMILLNTQNYLESDWCQREFAEAALQRIGIIQLIWPDLSVEQLDISSHISFPIQLNGHDFVNHLYNEKDKSKLTDEIMIKIIEEVESVRARSLASRQDSLITDFVNTAKKNNINITVQPERFLTEDLTSGKRIVYIPTVGIPQSINCQYAEIRKELYKHSDVSIRLIYDDLRIRDYWLSHLDWLNDNFKKDILTLKKKDFNSWFQKR